MKPQNSRWGEIIKIGSEIEKLESKNNTESTRGDFKAGLHSTLSMYIYIISPELKHSVLEGNSLRLRTFQQEIR